MTDLRCRVAGLLAALLLVGCAKVPPKIVPAEGVVLLDGKPLPNAEVSFVPMIQGFGAEYIASGMTDEQGRFKLMCNGQEGACACVNRITVTEPPLPKEFRGEQAQEAASKHLATLKNRPIPEKFGNLAQSVLSVEVTADGKEHKIELTR